MEIHYFEKWPYQQALEWMYQAQYNALMGQFAIAFGDHDKNIITLGRHANLSDVKDESNLEIFRINRGGRATMHGPGQLVVYPVINLNQIKMGVRDFTCLIEKSIINVLSEYGIIASCASYGAGVFVGDAKIASIGFHIHKGVVTHGLSLNVSNNISLFKHIVPCGKDDLQITSMYQLGIKNVKVMDVGTMLVEKVVALC